MYEETVDPTFRARKNMSLWTRNTIPWTLECEGNPTEGEGRFTRSQALEKVQSLEEGKSWSDNNTAFLSKSVDSFKTDVDNTVSYTIYYCIIIAVAVCLSPCGPCMCFSNPDDALFDGIGALCTVVFSIILAVLSILTCT